MFDGIGGVHLQNSYRALGNNGTLVVFGFSSDVDKGLRAVVSGIGIGLRLKMRMDNRRVRFYAITLSPGARPKQCRDDWQTLLQMKADGQLDPVVGAQIRLERVAEAHHLIDRSAVIGKIVLTVGGETVKPYWQSTALLPLIRTAIGR